VDFSRPSMMVLAIYLLRPGVGTITRQGGRCYSIAIEHVVNVKEVIYGPPLLQVLRSEIVCEPVEIH
jgi:hypothetical protein